MEPVQKYTKAQNTKKSIQEAAMELMKERGYIDTTVRDICAKAGVSVGTFYTYFPRKEDLFADLFSAADELFCNEVAHNLKGDTCREKIIDYFRHYAKLNLDSGIEVMKVIYNAENTWFLKARPMHYVLIDLIAEGQRSGEIVSDAIPYDIAFYFYTIARGCCYGWCLRNGHYDLESIMTDYIARALVSYLTEK